MIRVDQRELDRLARLFKTADKEQKRRLTQINARILPFWRRALAQQSLDPVHQRIAKYARAGQRRTGLVVRAGSAGHIGETKLREFVRAWEFGGRQDRIQPYLGRNQHTAYKAARRSQTHIPAKNPDGYMVYPAFAQIMDDLASAWVGALVTVWRERLGE